MSNFSDEEPVGFSLAACFLHRLGHPLFVKGFQQIVDRVHFKCLHGILVECGGKNDFRQRDFSIKQLLDHAKAVEARHLHIEENQVRIVFADEIDAFEAILALGHDVNIANILQQESELVASELFIVHDYS